MNLIVAEFKEKSSNCILRSPLKKKEKTIEVKNNNNNNWCSPVTSY